MLKPKIAPYIVEIVKEIQDAGFEAYIVGGAVRDFLLNRQPKDYDLSCGATPEQIRRIFKKRRTLIIGRRFKLVHLFHEREIIEISTFRKRPSATGAEQMRKGKPGRDVPENMIFRDNEYGSSEEDALRRDFTVNALFYDPVNDKIVDYTGLGLSDIHAGIVRTIGDAGLRFQEDPVRVLRALKLVGQYGFSMDDETKASVQDCLDLIHHVSNSRLTLELEKILKSPYGDKILDSFHRYGFLKRFLPFLDANWETPWREYMSKLWRLRNERVVAKTYRDSISVAISLVVLPFVERRLGATEPGALWEFFPGLDGELEDAIRAVFTPRALTRRAIAAAVRNLMLQTRIREASGAMKIQRHPGYPHARELGLLQNSVAWHLSSFEELWPKARHHSSDFLGDGPGQRRPFRERRSKRPFRQPRDGQMDAGTGPFRRDANFEDLPPEDDESDPRGGPSNYEDLEDTSSMDSRDPSGEIDSTGVGEMGERDWGHEFRSPI